jgi:hypothetical protein
VSKQLRGIVAFNIRVYKIGCRQGGHEKYSGTYELKANFEVSTFVKIRVPFFWNTTLLQLAIVIRRFLATSKAVLFNSIFLA